MLVTLHVHSCPREIPNIYASKAARYIQQKCRLISKRVLKKKRDESIYITFSYSKCIHQIKVIETPEALTHNSCDHEQKYSNGQCEIFILVNIFVRGYDF